MSRWTCQPDKLKQGAMGRDILCALPSSALGVSLLQWEEMCVQEKHPKSQQRVCGSLLSNLGHHNVPCLVRKYIKLLHSFHINRAMKNHINCYLINFPIVYTQAGITDQPQHSFLLNPNATGEASSIQDSRKLLPINGEYSKPWNL